MLSLKNEIEIDLIPCDFKIDFPLDKLTLSNITKKQKVYHLFSMD